ncbi:oligopeptide ABC transporter permease [Virgibacillus halodenitrificans]|uniref:Peptide ABC transporter permease n=1 Tax=Virgibacillus halodenitrificans TaxID=1482 RepID=A0AAC9J0Q6_VIRHA|nr:oligopeptide ABC transporter permease [Virgibacillus halodenitrificans]APC49231.1 peptide ABC transporter permease [Virgibacillus halodenitrificans]MCG1026746.1 ABC transporter permease [Virgibacillus halodenitrificans]MCJ0930149.1 ABC transporter permease [Virgibacillus halodenitrificans]MEC2161064.1 ABC transporter permease [Virgibacillus halodenitrificans]MYL45858.1 ABC transporter permease subunit [Virgibacillus halodenitrificans]
MWKFIVRRLFITAPQIVLLSVLVFLMAQMMPGDALSGLIDPNIDPQAIEQQREKLGLNNPWYIQYKDWVVSALQGDLGQSFRFKMPVTDLVEQRLINTFWLSLATLIITYLIAIPLGITSGRFNDTLRDQIITGYTYIGFATPLFIFALVMLWLFGFHFQWFPTSGSVAPGSEAGSLSYVISKLHHLLLPAISMALITTVNTVQYLRSEIIDTKQKDFIITARAKGASESRVYNRHILRNSLLPIAAFFGYEITGLIGGTVFVEFIYSYPGMGLLFMDSILQRDYSVVTSVVLLFGIASILGALLSDIILSLIDPRIRIK